MRLNDYPDDREVAVIYQRERLVFTDPPSLASHVTASRQERAFRRRAGPAAAEQRRRRPRRQAHQPQTRDSAMTYGPGTGYPQQPQQPYQGPLRSPHPPAPQSPGPRRARQAALIAAAIAAVVGAGVAITVMLVSGGNNTAWSGGISTSRAPASATGPQSSTSNPAGNARPLPPPTPTGKPYATEDPKEGECADLSLTSDNKVSIYQADCADPAATLIMESVITPEQNCRGRGYFALRTMPSKKLCMTYNFDAGDCIDMKIPRRTSCDATPAAPSDPPILTILEVRLGQRDGTGCRNPTVFFQVGQDDQRGIACGGSAKDAASRAPFPSK